MDDKCKFHRQNINRLSEILGVKVPLDGYIGTTCNRHC